MRKEKILHIRIGKEEKESEYNLWLVYLKLHDEKKRKYIEKA